MQTEEPILYIIIYNSLFILLLIFFFHFFIQKDEKRRRRGKYTSPDIECRQRSQYFPETYKLQDSLLQQEMSVRKKRKLGGNAWTYVWNAIQNLSNLSKLNTAFLSQQCVVVWVCLEENLANKNDISCKEARLSGICIYITSFYCL